MAHNRKKQLHASSTEIDFKPKEQNEIKDELKKNQ